MDEKNQIEKERWDIARIMSQNFHINDVGWDESDFEWTAHCLQQEGYHKQEWISVGERLPHSQQMVIGYTPCDGYMFVGFYQKVDSPHYKSYWNVITAMRSTRKMTKKVTHWMPLPEPPKMKGGEE